MALAAAGGGEPRPRRRWALAAGGALVLAVAALGWPWVRAGHYLTAARQFLEQGDPAAALDPLQHAEEIQPNRAEVQYLLAVARRRTGQLDRFQAHLARARELGWSPKDLERQEWLAVAQSGGVATVQGRLMELIERGVADDLAEEIYEAVARGHLAACRLRDAWLCLDMWLRWRPDAPQARLMRAALHEEMGEIDPAVADYRTAIEGLPGHGGARLRLGELLVSQDRIGEAREQFLACLAVNPADADALLGAARCARASKEDREAHRLLEEALQGDLPARRRAQVLAELGGLLLDENKVPESIEALTQAVALAPAEGPIHHKLSLALFRAGQAERGESHDRRAQQIRREQERLITIRRLVLDKPRDAGLRCEAAAILIGEGFMDDGLGWLLSALECDPRHRKTHELLADCYAQAGNPQLAARHRLLAAPTPAPALPAKPK